jgi:hypothetical protein
LANERRAIAVPPAFSSPVVGSLTFERSIELCGRLYPPGGPYLSGGVVRIELGVVDGGPAAGGMLAGGAEVAGAP